MQTKTFCCFLLVVLVTAGSAAPGRIAVVPASGRASLTELARAGVLVYARTERYVFAQPVGGMAAGTPALELSLSPGRATYLVYSAHVRAPLSGSVLWQDGSTLLMQLSPTEADAASRQGAELRLLPDKPHPIRLAPERSYPLSPEADTLIERLIANVSADSIRKQIQRLQDFGTRFTPTESCHASEQYIFDYFTSLGMDSVELDSYSVYGYLLHNVVGTKVGRRNPDKVAIICGHLDCTSDDPWNLAPGAEDNASGTAMAIEAARVLVGESLDQTVKFIAFTGEEQGLLGSFHFAEAMRNIDADITGVLNFDMIAWPGGQFGVSIFCDSASYGLAEMEGHMAELYTTLDHQVVVGSYGSDQLAFHEYGYQATAGAEYGSWYPYYHTTGDTIGNLSMPLAAEVAKMGIAGLVTLAMSPGTPDSFRLWDVGTGGALEATWKENTDSDLAGYRLMWGTTSGVYTDSLLVGRVSHQRINGLVDGTRYYATIVALDSAGHESGPAPEQNAVPGVRPLSPQGVSARPFFQGMATFWLRNQELDLAGYNIYRSTVSGSGYAKVNGALVTDTTYRDSGLMSDTMYYYVVTAVDSSANEGNRSAEVRGKPITLDHGILLVDETRDGNGQRGSPSDAQQDAFYRALLRGTSYSDWDVATESVPQAGDVGPYSTIVWHADDYTQQRLHPAVPGLANYLQCGGRLWLVGWKPILGLLGSGSYPFLFSPGQMPYEELHLDAAGQCPTNNFFGASGQSGYPDISIDSMKLFASFHGRLPYADVLYPRDADTVLTFNAALGDSFQDKPVGVRWLAGPGKVVSFGFPLYYTVESEARAVALKVLADLGEPYGIEEGAKSRAEMKKVLPTVVHGVLYLPPSSLRLHPSYLLSVDGRRVMSLHPGANDVRGLAPGVYFVRDEPQAASLKPQAIRKVVLTK
ncbi:M28 family peptidase [candidate division WOR-3 bacterium]|uniref:M28 family peptidase n=1 Tax=candidate division WOR-3 bacterium TaxID=2052148 RepID=A0A937XKK5_UNCW3|nr:M28 family peptidase [candidate division WOR-3 bacterium]